MGFKGSDYLDKFSVRTASKAFAMVQELDIPDSLKALYKTVWEIKQRKLVDMAADRGAFIDQSQSFNVHMSDCNFGKLTSLHFHAWKVWILADFMDK